MIPFSYRILENSGFISLYKHLSDSPTREPFSVCVRMLTAMEGLDITFPLVYEPSLDKHQTNLDDENADLGQT